LLIQLKRSPVQNKFFLIFSLSALSLFLLSIIGNTNQLVFADSNFGAAGDYGCTSNTDATLSNMKGKGPERVFALGDYSYASTGSCFFNKIDPTGLTGITKIAIGNHEDDSSEGFSGYMSHFGLSKTYYSYDFDNVHVLVMDTDHDSYSSGSAQRSFVQSDLQAASTNPNIKWIIVYLHKELYTSPNTCSSGSCSNTGSEPTNLRNGFHAMFDQYGVDLVLSGHVHNYQRTFQIKYSGSSTPTITNNNANTYTEGNGEIFAIVGVGGVNFHALSGKAKWVSSQQDSSFGQLDIKTTNSGNTLEGKFYKNGNNAVLDSFTINKAGNIAPVASSQAVTVTTDTARTLTLNATDANNDPLTYSIVTLPQHGTMSPTTPGGPSRTYTPTTGYVGPDSFQFKANDGTLDSNTATISITVQANAAPVASNQAVTTTKNTAKAITLTATDANNDPLTYSIVTQPAQGTLSPTTPGGPSRTYTPTTGYVGPDSFQFKANDGKVDSNTATVSITVQDVTTTCTTNLPISAVTASGSQSGNPATNVLDNSLSTRWANNGVGSWIRADLGSTQNICSVSIAWAYGNIEKYHFVIATSLDGTTFTNKFSGDSSGTTLNSENYPIPATDARYVRVTVNGNTDPSFGTWASIAELDIFGSSSSALASTYNYGPSLTLTGPTS
jgi:hypothetical protein